LFAATALLDDLHEAGFELFDRRHVLSEDAHLARLGWDVDLDTERRLGSAVCNCIGFIRFSEVGNVHIGGFVDGLQTNNVSKKPVLRFLEALGVPFAADDALLKMAYLVRKCKR
jgi:hypothetical protein